MCGFIPHPSGFQQVLHTEIERNTNTVLFHHTWADAVLYEAVEKYERALLNKDFVGTAGHRCDLHQQRLEHVIDYRRMQVHFMAAPWTININPTILDAEEKRLLVETGGSQQSSEPRS